MDDRDQAAESHRPGLRDHVLLGDPALEEAIREALAELDQPAVLAQVGVERDQPRLALGLLDQRLAVGADEPLAVLGRGGQVLGRLGDDELDRLAPSCESRPSSRVRTSSTARS